MQLRTIPVAACLVVLAGSVLGADARLEYKVTEGTAPGRVVWVGADKIRIDQGNETSVIIDPVAEVLIGLNHKEKTFQRLDRASSDKLGAEWLDNIKEMKELLATLPDDESRAVMAKLLADMETIGNDFTVTELPTPSSVGGRACKIVQGKIKTEVLTESCVGPVASLGLGDAEVAALERAGKFGGTLAKGILKTLAPQIPEQSLLMTASGIVLRETFIRDGKRNSVELATITRDAIPASTFLVPAGYTEDK